LPQSLRRQPRRGAQARCAFPLPLPAGPDPGAARQALAPLAALCREDAAHASAALALVALVLRRHLPAAQWLPALQQARAWL